MERLRVPGEQVGNTGIRTPLDFSSSVEALGGLLCSSPDLGLHSTGGLLLRVGLLL